MPVNFLTAEQRKCYGHYLGSPLSQQLERYFFLDDVDKELINQCRTEHSRLGFAAQLGTVRFLGTFLDDLKEIPENVLLYLAKQLGIENPACISKYYNSGQRWIHAATIRDTYNYKNFTDPLVGFRLIRWLYALCWTGTDQPSILFDRTTSWLLSQKVLLPGPSILERLIARVRQRVQERVWRFLTKSLTSQHEQQLSSLLTIPEGSHTSKLDQLRWGPTYRSVPSLIRSLERLEEIRKLSIVLPKIKHIPKHRILTLARFASTAKISAIERLSEKRKLATLVAFVHMLEAKAQDEAIELLEVILGDIFTTAKKLHQKTRLRTLRDLDQAALQVHQACSVLVDERLKGKKIRDAAFALVPKPQLEMALHRIIELVSPPDNVYYQELQEGYKRIVRLLPHLLKEIKFGATPVAQPLLEALSHIKSHKFSELTLPPLPSPATIPKQWKDYVVNEDKTLNTKAYILCTFDQIRFALKRRDLYLTTSIRYADPRLGLLEGNAWEEVRPMVCRSLNLPVTPHELLANLEEKLDQAYHQVAAHLPQNLAINLKMLEDNEKLSISPLDKLDEPASLIALREAVNERLPRVDLSDVLLEIAARTKFFEHFTHISETQARIEDFQTSICAVLMSEACNTGIEPLIHDGIPALKRGRLSWIFQNYLRQDTIVGANACLVSEQNKIPLARSWGGGEVASADGLRFVVPIRTVHAGPNPRYYGIENGVTYYNLISDQFTGLAGITVPGTLRDSLSLLGLVLEQQTELTPLEIMTDTGAYTDIMFALFWLLGYQFSPRLADIGGKRFWRTNNKADYGPFNSITRHKINMKVIAENWEDILRLAGSLKLGTVQAYSVMRMLQVGGYTTRLAQALGELGKLIKTLHNLNYIHDETKRRRTLLQLNRGEGRHQLARAVFHAKKGELRQRYREGQEDQLGALGLVVNIIVLWNTIYMDKIIQQLKTEGFLVKEEDVARLSPLGYQHINMLGRYAFNLPDFIARGELRPLRNPKEQP